jgi:hypothetical protein
MKAGSAADVEARDVEEGGLIGVGRRDEGSVGGFGLKRHNSGKDGRITKEEVVGWKL